MVFNFMLFSTIPHFFNLSLFVFIICRTEYLPVTRNILLSVFLFEFVFYFLFDNLVMFSLYLIKRKMKYFEFKCA